MAELANWDDVFASVEQAKAKAGVRPTALKEPETWDDVDAAVTEVNAKDNLANRNEFMRGLYRGADALQATYQGGLGMYNSVVGNEAAAQDRFRKYQEEMRQAAENPATEMKFFSTDQKTGAFGSVGNLGTYAAGVAGAAVPSLTEAVLTGIAGAAIGAAVIPAPDPGDVVTAPIGAIGGLFGRGAIKSAIAKTAQEYVKRNVAPEAAEQLAKQYVKREIAKRVGATVAVQQTTALHEGGGMWAEGMERGYNAPVSALALGQASGLSEAVFGAAPGALRAFMGRAGVDEIASKSGMRAAAGYLWDITKNAGEEGVQEGFQEFLGSVNNEINDPNFNIFSKENFMQWAEAAAAGSIVGGAARTGIVGTDVAAQRLARLQEVLAKGPVSRKDAKELGIEGNQKTRTAVVAAEAEHLTKTVTPVSDTTVTPPQQELRGESPEEFSQRMLEEEANTPLPKGPIDATQVQPNEASQIPGSSEVQVQDAAKQPSQEPATQEVQVEPPKPQPVRVYHGTDTDAFTQFDDAKIGSSTDSGLLGAGHYFSTDADGMKRNKKTLVAADISLSNPLKLSMPDFKTDKNALANKAIGTTGLAGKDLSDAIKAQGFDGVELDYSKTGYAHKEYAVFDAAGIKVAPAEIAKPPETPAPQQTEAKGGVTSPIGDFSSSGTSEEVGTKPTTGPTENQSSEAPVDKPADIGAVKSDKDIAIDIYESSKGNPNLDPDSALGKGAEPYRMHWMDSDTFTLAEVPIANIDWDTSHKTDTPKATGPIVIDANRRNVWKAGGSGRRPKVTVLDGQNRLEQARKAGKTTIQAWVGDKANEHLFPQPVAETSPIGDKSPEPIKIGRKGAAKSSGNSKNITARPDKSSEVDSKPVTQLEGVGSSAPTTRGAALPATEQARENLRNRGKKKPSQADLDAETAAVIREREADNKVRQEFKADRDAQKAQDSRREFVGKQKALANPATVDSLGFGDIAQVNDDIKRGRVSYEDAIKVADAFVQAGYLPQLRRDQIRKPSPEPTGEQDTGTSRGQSGEQVGNKPADLSTTVDKKPEPKADGPTTDDDADAMMDGILGDMEDAPKDLAKLEAAGIKIKQTKKGWSVTGLPDNLSQEMQDGLKAEGGRRTASGYFFKDNPTNRLVATAEAITDANKQLDEAAEAGMVSTPIGILSQEDADWYRGERQQRLELAKQMLNDANEAVDELLGQFVPQAKRGLFKIALNKAAETSDPTSIPRFDEMVEYSVNHPELGLPQDENGLFERLRQSATQENDLEQLIDNELAAELASGEGDSSFDFGAPSEPAQPQQMVTKADLQQIRKELLAESVGGNAGKDRAGVAFLVDPETQDVVFWGVGQTAPQPWKELYHSGKLDVGILTINVAKDDLVENAQMVNGGSVPDVAQSLVGTKIPYPEPAQPKQAAIEGLEEDVARLESKDTYAAKKAKLNAGPETKGKQKTFLTDIYGDPNQGTLFDTDGIAESQPQKKSEQTKAKANEKREQASEDEADFGKDVGNTLGITATGVPLAGPHRGMGKSIQHFFQRFFTSQGELPTDVYDSMVRKEGRVAQEMNRLRQRATDFRRAIKKALGGKELTQADIERMNEVLRGDALPSTLPVKLRAPIKAMRDHIDALSSQLILEGVAQGDLVGLIAEHMGVYATRSYRVFDNPKWRDQVPDVVRNRAIAAIRAMDPSKSDAEVAGMIESLLYRGAADTPVALLKGSKLGSKDLTSFMARKDIPEWLRELWGEYKDAGVNYARSVFKMAHLLANQQFLNEVREAGLGKWLRTEEEGPIINEYGEVITKIAADTSSVMEPLNGLLTTPEIKAAFERFDSPGAMPEWLRMFMTVNYSVKYGKTVGSVMTHVRNMVSNAGFAVANGHWRVGKAVNAAWGTVTGTFQLSNEKFRDYYNHLAELGLVGEDVRAGELKDALRDASQADVDEFLYNAEARHAKKVVGFGRAVFRGLNSLYQAEDAVWKIYAWENEKARYSKAYPKWSEQQVEEHAAKIVRNTYPTYSKIPEAIKSLRRFPVIGTFVSFPSEVVRTTFHTIKLGIDEMQSSETRVIGAQRLAGTVVSIGILSVLSRGMMAMFGIDDDEDKDLRWFVPPWQENSRFIYLNKPKDATFHFVDLGYSDPHAYLTDSVVAFMRGKDWKDSLGKATAEFMSPFASEEILAKALMDLRSNKDEKIYNPHDEIGEQAKDIVSHLWNNALEPGTFSSGRRIITAIGGTDPSKSVRDEVLAVTTGQRLQKVDVEHSLGFRVRDFNKALTQIQGIARKTVTSRGTATGAMVATDLARMEKLRLVAFAEMQQIAGAARRLGVPEESIRTLMKAELPNDVAEQLMTGDYSVYEMTPQTVRQMMDAKPAEFKQRFEAWHGQKTPEAIQSYIGPRLAGLDKDSDLKKIKGELDLLGLTFDQAEQALKEQWKVQYGSAYESGVLKVAVKSRRDILLKVYETK